MGAGDLSHVDATLVRADVSLDSLVKRHAEEVIEKIDGDPMLLSGPPARSGRLKCVSRTDPDCAMATNRRGRFSEPTYKTHVAADSKARVIVDVAVTAPSVRMVVCAAAMRICWQGANRAASEAAEVTEELTLRSLPAGAGSKPSSSGIG